jgi:DNA-binding MarR family transcriptional regulator
MPDGVDTLISLLKVATRIASPMRDMVADPEGLSVTELRILLALGGEGALAGHDLSELMAMQPMNVSRALATLLGMGLVEPVGNIGNRRRKPYQLSSSGQAKFTAMQAEMQSVAAFVFGGLTKAERHQASSLLAKLDARLAEWQAPADGQHVSRP